MWPKPPQSMTSNRSHQRARPSLRAWDFVQLFVLATHHPALWLAANVRNQPDFAAVGLVTAALFVLAVAAAGTSGAFTRQMEKAVGACSMAILVFWYWPSLVLDVGPVAGEVAAVAITVLLLLVGWVYGSNRRFRVVALTAGLTMLSVGFALLTIRWLPERELHVRDTSELGVSVGVSNASPPDIYVVVLDGMARSDVLKDLYEFDDSDFRRSLEIAGFSIASEATANYSITHMSLASMLDMRYPLEPGPVPTTADFDELARIMSGDNRFIETLRSAGYSYIHGEHHWWGTRCDPAKADLCLPTPGTNLTAFELLSTTPVGYLLERPAGYPAATATLGRLDQLEEWDRVIGGLPHPHVVFLHFGLPHPPLYLDRNCSPIVDPLRRGTLLNGVPQLPDEVLAERRAAYVGQVECAHRVVDAVLAAAPPGAVVLFVSDHGPDSLGQLGMPPEEVDLEGQWERLSALVSVRLPTTCQDPVPSDISLVNLLPRVLNCVFDAELELVADRYFIAGATGTPLPLVEVQDPDVTYSAASG